MTDEGEQQDGEWEQSRWVYASPEEGESHADIEVNGCVYCGNREVGTTFTFVQTRGLRVAVPGRVGLCGTAISYCARAASKPFWRGRDRPRSPTSKTRPSSN